MLNISLADDLDITFYGIDNNFINCPIIKESTDFGFNFFDFDSSYFDDEMFENKGMYVIIPENFIDSDSIERLEILDKKTKVIGTYKTLFKTDKTCIFLPITTMNDIFNRYYGVFKVNIYFDISENGLPEYFNNDLLEKNSVNTIVNKYVEIANDSISTYISLILVATAAISILCIVTIKNRYNEIGIKLAIGAKKSDIVLEFLTENLALVIFSSLLSFGLSIFITLILESLNTLILGFSCIAINWSTCVFTLGIFIMSALISVFIPSLIAVNANIEKTLKEER